MSKEEDWSLPMLWTRTRQEQFQADTKAQPLPQKMMSQVDIPERTEISINLNGVVPKPNSSLMWKLYPTCSQESPLLRRNVTRPVILKKQKRTGFFQRPFDIQSIPVFQLCWERKGHPEHPRSLPGASPLNTPGACLEPPPSTPQEPAWSLPPQHPRSLPGASPLNTPGACLEPPPSTPQEPAWSLPESSFSSPHTVDVHFTLGEPHSSVLGLWSDPVTDSACGRQPVDALHALGFSVNNMKQVPSGVSPVASPQV
ncbi:hypothetical protein A6R68_02690, partial [Neotoma lepida]